ncbi:hypothetical protein OAV33_00825 [bacterium]|nr:hypothetical protein [bacterium]
MSFTDRLGLSVSQAVFAWGLIVLIGGVAGLFSMLLCFYVLSFGGVDSANKHGISQVSATRVGGLGIVSYMLMHLGYQFQLGVYLPVADESFIMLTCLAFLHWASLKTCKVICPRARDLLRCCWSLQ